MDKLQRRVRLGKILWTSITVLAMVCLTVPTLLAIFYHITPTWFKIINVLGLALASIRICMTMVTGVMVSHLKEKASKGLQKQIVRSIFLIIFVVIVQMVNLMFIHFE